MNQRSNQAYTKGAQMKSKDKRSFKGKKKGNNDARIAVPDSKGVEYDAYKSEPNDPRWYAENAQLLADAASFPYGWPLGNRLDYGQYGADANYAALPGIMTLQWAPSVGYSNDANSAVNIAARNVYSFVRHANSGHSNYDAPDLMLYLLAMDSLYVAIEDMKRAYGVLNTASYTNRYFPRAMVKALGYDYNDLLGHIADFRSFINQCVVKVGSMCVPASMSFMAKHMWMSRHVWSDQNSPKSQTYAFVPSKLWIFGLDEDGAGMLDVARLHNVVGNNELTFTAIRSLVLDMIDAVMEQEDFNIMSGDILKAYGPGGVFKLPSIPENYAVVPMYDERALDQIQNASLVGFVDETQKVGNHYASSFGVRQSTQKDYLIFLPETRSVHSTRYASTSWKSIPLGNNVFGCNRVITFTHDGITAADTMEATRLTNICDAPDAPTDLFHMAIRTCGSEIALTGRVWTYCDPAFPVSQNLNGWDTAYWTFDMSLVRTIQLVRDSTDPSGKYTIDLTNNGAELEKFNIQLEMIDQFNRHPAVAVTGGYYITTDGAAAWDQVPIPMSGYMFDTDNYTVLDKDDLIEMSQIALLSEFNITQYGRSLGK